MARELKAHIYVNGTHYGPGDDVPAEVAEQITNPKAWGEPAADEGAAKKAAASKTAAKK